MSLKSADDNIESSQLTRESAQDLVDEIIRRYGCEISALDVLEEYSELRQHRSCVVDLAYEEYANAREKGEEIPPTDFVRKFEGVEQSLYRILEFDQLLREDPSLVEPFPEDRWPRKGQTIQNFKLLSDLGRGALSRVFLARHTQLGDKAVVVKVCIRGEQEAVLLGRLAHPAIGEVHSVTTDPETGLAVICMPYQTRCTIHEVAEWLENERRDGRTVPTPRLISDHVRSETQINVDGKEAEAFRGLAAGYHADDDFDQLVVRWGMELCAALQHAHEKGILHCDVKPGNILVLPDLSVRLLDFNLATRREDQALMAGGTPPFMAPEQLRLMLQVVDGHASDQLETPLVDVGEQADVFGLCATLWHLVTGAPPFGTTADFRTPTDAAMTMLTRHTMGVGSNLVQQADRRIPTALVNVLLQGMAINRDERFQSMSHLHESLAACLRKRRDRRFWAVAGISALLAISVGASAYLYIDPAASALASSRRLYAAGRFDEASQTLGAYQSDSPFSQVWGLAFGTVRTPLPVRRQNAPFLVTRPLNLSLDDEIMATYPLVSRWEWLADDWERLARESPYEMECWYNSYLCRLECQYRNDQRRFAFIALDNALSRGLDRERFRHDLLLRRLAGVTISKEVDLQALEELVMLAPDLSRGQFLLLDEAFRQAQSATTGDPENRARVHELKQPLFPILTADGWLVEPYGVDTILDNPTSVKMARKWKQGPALSLIHI